MSAKIKMTQDEFDKLMRDSGRYHEEPEVKVKKSKKKSKSVEKKKSKEPKTFGGKAKKMVMNAPMGAVDVAKTALSFGKKYKARDYAGSTYNKTATMKNAKRPYSPNSLRNEWVSHSPTSPETGLAYLYTNERGWKSSKMVAFPKTSPQGVNPRSKGSLRTRGREFPSINEVQEHIGGDPLVPRVRKIRKVVL